MKKFIIIAVTAATLGAGAITAHAGWFNNDEEEKQRRIEVEQKLEKQEHATGNWMVAAFVMGLGAVVALISGTIIGSRAIRHANRNQ